MLPNKEKLKYCHSRKCQSCCKTDKICNAEKSINPYYISHTATRIGYLFSRHDLIMSKSFIENLIYRNLTEAEVYKFYKENQ